jgi:hypothetical protein
MNFFNFYNSMTPESEQAESKNLHDVSHDDEWTLQGDDDIDELDESEEMDHSRKRTKSKFMKPIKKKKQHRFVDERHPAEEIYLQRIEAPHEYAMRKANMRKKKRKQLPPLTMDENNDVFDMDF